MGKLAKFSESPGPKHYKALVWLLGYVRHTHNKGIKFYHRKKDSPIYQVINDAKVDYPLNHMVTFTDASWQDCTDTGRSTCGRISFFHGGAIDHASYTPVPVPVAMSSGEAEYLGAAGAAIAAAHLRVLWYDFKYLGTSSYSICTKVGVLQCIKRFWSLYQLKIMKLS